MRWLKDATSVLAQDVQTHTLINYTSNQSVGIKTNCSSNCGSSSSCLLYSVTTQHTVTHWTSVLKRQTHTHTERETHTCQAEKCKCTQISIPFLLHVHGCRYSRFRTCFSSHKSRSRMKDGERPNKHQTTRSRRVKRKSTMNRSHPPP